MIFENITFYIILQKSSENATLTCKISINAEDPKVISLSYLNQKKNKKVDILEI